MKLGMAADYTFLFRCYLLVLESCFSFIGQMFGQMFLVGRTFWGQARGVQLFFTA